MSRLFGRVFLAAILLLTTGQLTWAASGNKTTKLKDVAVGKVVQVGSVKFVKVAGDQYLALDLCPTGSTYSSFYKGCVVATTDFAYTGGEQMFSASANMYYVLEVWGGQGASASSTYRGGYGGYAIGLIKMTTTKQLYIYTGGQGATANGNATTSHGGFNGGGNGWDNSNATNGAGGGATHIALKSGLLSTLSGDASNGNILLVAGGGGGAMINNQYPTQTTGGNGGGITAGIGTFTTDRRIRQSPTGGSQTSGGLRGYNYSNTATGIDDNMNGGFGAGGRGDAGRTDGTNADVHIAGGGGGYYGGGAGYLSTTGGGSGYVGSSSLLSTRYELRHMTCYSCTTSTDPNTYTISNTCASEEPTADCAKIGNGAARITQLSVYLGI